MWSLISDTPEVQNWTRFKSVLMAVWISKSDLNQTHNCIYFKSNMQAAWNAMQILQHLKKKKNLIQVVLSESRQLLPHKEA